MALDKFNRNKAIEVMRHAAMMNYPEAVSRCAVSNPKIRCGSIKLTASK